jgi:DNA ligase-1
MKDVDKWNGLTPLPMLYAKAATGAITTWLCWVKGKEVCVQWGQLGGQVQGASFTCEPKNVGRANETSAADQAILEAIAKWKKQLKKKYYLTEEAARGGLNLKPMLAKTFKDHAAKVTYPVTVQPKFDGVRCLAYLKEGKVFLQSRGGDPYVLPHIMQFYEGLIGEGEVLDGELYVHGMSRQNIIALVKKPRPESVQVKHWLYDRFVIGTDEPWVKRTDNLDSWFLCNANENCPVVRCDEDLAKCEADVKALHDKYVKDGFEGAIIRRWGDAGYKIGYRSSDLLKYKNFDDDEFKVVGFKAGKGKFENVPIFECQMKDGKLFDVTPKGTDTERAQMLKEAPLFVAAGAMLTVRHFGYSDEGKPYFPVGVGFRGKEDLSEGEDDEG